jgi:hypothetical protein
LWDDVRSLRNKKLDFLQNPELQTLLPFSGRKGKGAGGKFRKQKIDFSNCGKAIFGPGIILFNPVKCRMPIF